jgi:energy-converting hydrogenase A subunit M
MTKPEIGYVFPALVSGHLLWREMSVIVDNRKIFRRIVKKLARCLREEKEIVIKIYSSHGERLGYEVNQGQARIS